MTQDVFTEDRDLVRWIEIRRPESRNGLTPETDHELIAAIAAAEPAGARVIVITGAGGHFCSGLDLKEAMRRGPRPPAELERDLRGGFHALIRAVRAAPQPVVAAVDGWAVGFGCDLALACDIRLVSDRARFGELFVKRGLMPDGGGTYSLPRLIGLGRALELMLTGEPIDAAEAQRVGLCSRVLPAEGFAAAAWEYAVSLAKGAPLVHRHIKRAVYASIGELDAALEREAVGQLELVASSDFLEGVAAFLQKREPRFQGK